MPFLIKPKKLIQMETKITKNIDGSWDLSQINNIGDLEAEIAYLKTKVEGDFAQIKNDTTQLPKQAFNSTVGKALPFLSTDKSNKSTDATGSPLSFLNSGNVGIATTILSTVGSFFLFRKRKKRAPSLKANITGTARGLATTAAVQGGIFLFDVLSKWNNRRQARKEIRDLRVKTEVLKLLKEDQKERKSS